MTATVVAAALLAAGAAWAGWAWVADRARLPVAVAVSSVALLGAAVAATIATPVDQRAAIAAVSALGVGLAVLGGGPATTLVFGLVDRGSAGAADSMESAGAILRGGAWIGALERAAIAVSLVAGWPEGIAIVLAVKGLGRYPELRSQKSAGTAERFIIGTFTSVLWAAACAGVVVVLT
jgi:hypothetical protein